MVAMYVVRKLSIAISSAKTSIFVADEVPGHGRRQLEFSVHLEAKSYLVLDFLSSLWFCNCIITPRHAINYNEGSNHDDGI